MKFIINKNARILVIGDIMLDHYIYGVCNRISPEAPVQIVEVKKEEYMLGGAGNVLRNLKSFDIQVDLVSVVGIDDNARLIIDYLNAEKNGNYTIIKDIERCTTVKSRVLASNHQLVRLDREVKRSINDEIAQQLISAIQRDIKNYDVILISDYDKGVLSNFFLQQLFIVCREANVKTIVDPKGSDFSKYKGANIIKPNKKEAVIASGIVIADIDSLKLACAKLKEITNCDDIIITMSEEGMALYEEQELAIIPTKAIDIVDVTGAGDTVLACLGLALASNNTLYDACDFANHAAAVVVSKIGSATTTLDEIENKTGLS